jgi:hypothetical protein
MQLKMIRNVDNTTKIIISSKKGETLDFDYVKMVNILYEEKCIDKVEFEGEFLEDEKEKLKLLISNISTLIIEGTSEV